MKEWGEKQLNVSITTGTIVKGLFVILLFLVALEIRDIILLVLAAVVIASALEPLTKWFVRHGLKRIFAVIIGYVLLASVFFGVIYFLFPVLLNDFSSYLANLPKYLTYVQAWIPVKSQSAVDNTAWLQQLSATSFSFSQVISNISASFTNVSQGFVQTVTTVFGGVLSFILVLVLSFYLSVQEDGISDFLRIVTPVRHEKYIIDLWKRSQHKIGLWMQGQLLLGVTVGVLVYLGLTVFGIEHALILALLAGVFEIIPVFGPIMSAIPGVLVAFADHGLTTGLIILGVYIIIGQFENQLFYPLVVKKIIGISPIIVIVALVIGAKLAGFIGIVLSVPLSTTLLEYVNDLQKDKISEHKREHDRQHPQVAQGH